MPPPEAVALRQVSDEPPNSTSGYANGQCHTLVLREAEDGL